MSSLVFAVAVVALEYLNVGVLCVSMSLLSNLWLNVTLGLKLTKVNELSSVKEFESFEFWEGSTRCLSIIRV